jgi:hypothetical protein
MRQPTRWTAWFWTVTTGSPFESLCLVWLERAVSSGWVSEFSRITDYYSLLTHQNYFVLLILTDLLNIERHFSNKRLSVKGVKGDARKLSRGPLRGVQREPLYPVIHKINTQVPYYPPLPRAPPQKKNLRNVCIRSIFKGVADSS